MTTESLIRQYITKSIHMSLGTTRDNKPWVCEVHFTYDDDLNIYFRSLSSTRHCQDIALNPQVAGNIVKQHEVGEYPHAIYFEGTAELIDSDEQIDALAPLFTERQVDEPDFIAKAKNPEGKRIYKITVENWYTFGKFGADKGSKIQLVWNGGKK